MKRIFIIVYLFILALNSFGQSELERDIIRAEEESYIRDTTLLDFVIEHAPSGTARDAGSGLSLDGNAIDLGGTLDQNTDIAGGIYNFNLGTGASKINTLTINGQNIAFNSDNSITLTASGVSCTWNGVLLICGTDTIATLADVREEIENSAPLLPFNFNYTFNVSTTDSRPGAGLFRLNNGVLSSVTIIYVDYYDSDNISQNVFLSAPDTGSYISIKTDVNNYALYQLTGALTDAGNYFKYNVTYMGHSGVIAGLSTIDLQLSNNVGGSGGGGVADSVFQTITSDTNYVQCANIGLWS
jgi:hypothetical protein